jgi:hypothetical protein
MLSQEMAENSDLNGANAFGTATVISPESGK